MSEFLTTLQDSAFSQWVASSPSLLAYPMFLTLHTVGMAVVVGTCVLLDLRILGLAEDLPLWVLARSTRLVWPAFGVNAATGVALFMIDAEHKATQWIFGVKLVLILLAMILYVRTRRRLADAAQQGQSDVTDTRALAVVSLVLWTGATVAGRLMAYLV